MHLARVSVVLAALAACARPQPGDTPARVDVTRLGPDASTALATYPSDAGVASGSCVLEGDGEPGDDVLFHEMPDLDLAPARGAAPLVRVWGRARLYSPGRWSELPDEAGDGRARVDLRLEKRAVQVFGYAPLAMTRFHARTDIPVVESHVWILEHALVRVLGIRGKKLAIGADVPFDAPKELRAVADCEALDWEPVRASRAKAMTKWNGHVLRVELHDAPHGPVVFEASTGLLFVEAGEPFDGFVHVTGARWGVRIDGFVPASDVDRRPTGAGDGAGHVHYRKGPVVRSRVGRTTRRAALFARRIDTGERVAIGRIEPDHDVNVLRDDGPWTTVSLLEGELTALPGAELVVARADVLF